jgi:hypothetical protein
MSADPNYATADSGPLSEGRRSDDHALLPSREYEGVHCVLTINRPAPAVAVVVLKGIDIGEFADLPMRELANDLARYGSIELFIDARAVRGASIEVSGEWALWMKSRIEQLRQIRMLTGSRYIQITAEFARRFVSLGERMQICTDPRVFEQDLRTAVQLAASA